MSVDTQDGTDGIAVGEVGTAVRMSLVGTNRTSWHVRSMVATGGKADMGWTRHFGSD